MPTSTYLGNLSLEWYKPNKHSHGMNDIKTDAKVVKTLHAAGNTEII